MVHVFEVDPTLRNKKVTFSQFRNYLDQYYAAFDDISLAGDITITGNLFVGQTISGNNLQATGVTQLNSITSTGTASFSGIVVQNDIFASGFVSGNVLTSASITSTSLTTVSGTFTAAGATPALVSSGLISGDSDLVVRGTITILP